MAQSLHKMAKLFEKVTSGKHPQSGTKNQADNSKSLAHMPADKPHIRADTMTEVNFKMEKVDSLEKGAARKIAPFDPSGEMEQQGGKLLTNWVEGNDPSSRENLPPMTGSARLRGLNKLRSATQMRINPQTNEREYLLHRGMSEDEATGHINGAIDTHTSWTPHFKVAHAFAQVIPASSGHVVSAWVPEKKIHSMPYMLGHDPRISGFRNEHEVVVGPHKTNVTSVKDMTEAGRVTRDKGLVSALKLKDLTLFKDPKDLMHEKIKQNMSVPVKRNKPKPQPIYNPSGDVNYVPKTQKSEHKDQIPGGLADKSQPKDFPPKQIKQGVKIEMEHTNDPSKAKEIAMDHLKEDRQYYTKLEVMEKGAARKIAPIDPRKDESTEHVRGWVSGEDDSLRQTTPRMEGAIRLRGLNKLGGAAQMRKNPETGEREFLLHRGMSFGENQQGSGDRITSWTPHFSRAARFANKADAGYIKSAWVPESQIHSMPYMHSHDRDIKRWRDEHEVLVSPHNFNVVESKPFKSAVNRIQADRMMSYIQLKNLSPEAAKRKIDANMGKQKLSQSQKPSLKKSAEKLLENLQKGSLQRKYRFNPSEVDKVAREKVENWTTGEGAYDRSDLPRIEGADRFRALHRLHSVAPSRRNPETGEREFLLHRGQTIRDIKEGGVGTDRKTSLTPFPGKAKSFSLDPIYTFANGPDSMKEWGLTNHPAISGLKQPSGSRTSNSFRDIVEENSNHLSNYFGNIYSYWVPESSIHHVPNQWGSAIYENPNQNKNIPGKQYRSDEHEVIVNTDKLKPHAIHKAGEMRDLQDQHLKHVNAVKGVTPTPARLRLKKNENLEKGQNGNWQKEGYSFYHMPNPKDPTRFVVYASHPNEGGDVGYAKFRVVNDNYVVPDDLHDAAVYVDKDHRRKGLGSGMYAHAEKLTGLRIHPSETQSAAGEAMWEHPERPFGKSESFHYSENIPEYTGRELSDRISKVMQIPIQHVIPTESVDDNHVNKIMSAIKSGKPLPAITVEFTYNEKHPDYDAFSVIDGHHRLEAAKRLGYTHVPVRIKASQDDWPNIKASGGFKPNLPPDESLQKGLRGDWQKEGYTLKHDVFNGIDDGLIPGKEHHITAHGPKGNIVGHFIFAAPDQKPGKLFIRSSEVHPDHQRKGIATAAYQLAEQKTNTKIHPDHQSDDAKALWSQPNRPFGKSEDLEKGLKGDWKKEGYTFSHQFSPSKTRHAKGYLKIFAHSPDQKVVGEYTFYHHPQDNILTVNMVETDPQHRRKGIATGAYQYAEQQLNAKVKSFPEERTDAGNALWSQPNRPFGKSLAKSDTADAETEEIRKNAKEWYDRPHKFKPAEWTYPNGHPRCIKCGREEAMSGMCGGKELFALLKKSNKEILEVSTVAVIDPDSMKMLMGKRDDNGLWTHPGGHLNAGEDPLVGAKRELFEEAGVKTKNLVWIGSEKVKGKDGKTRTIHCYVMNGKPKTTSKNDPDEEVSKWVWVPFEKGLPKKVLNNLHAKNNVLLKKLGLL